MRKSPLLATVAALTASLLLGGCVGQILGGDRDEDPGAGGDPIAPDEPRDVCASGKADLPGPRLLRRLTLPVSLVVRSTTGPNTAKEKS